MFEIIFYLAVIFQASSIALGVGSSTLAISSFMVAILDGTIDGSERRMLGVIYFALRVAMFGIVATTGFISLSHPTFLDPVEGFVWFLTIVLFLNAVAMTKHWISSKFGPAIQAATWYTLGFMATIHMFHLFDVNMITFIGLYVADLVTAFLVVNGLMIYFKKRNKTQRS